MRPLTFAPIIRCRRRNGCRRKVDRTCAGGEVHHVALRREYEHLVVEHIHFEIVNEVLRVGVLLLPSRRRIQVNFSLISGAGCLRRRNLYFQCAAMP